jgi:alkylated DNA nucleotide flippase Atl1
MTTNTEHKAMLKLYRASSDFYVALEANYGETLTLATAERLARQYGTTLKDLRANEHLPIHEGNVNALKFAMALGY